jgi:hypothetical protein
VSALLFVGPKLAQIVVADWASVKGECHGSGCREDARSDHLNSNGWPLGLRSQHVEYCAYYKPSGAESEGIIANPVSQANRFDTFFVGHFFARLLHSRVRFSRDSSLRRDLKAKAFLSLNGTDESVPWYEPFNPTHGSPSRRFASHRRMAI